MRRAVPGAGVITAAALVLGACGVGGLVGPENRDEVGYSVTEPVRAVEVDTGAGDITVVESDRTGVAVTETLVWRGGEDGRPRTTHEVSGDRLTLTHECAGGLARGNCDVHYRVEVPRGVEVKAESGSGRIMLRDLSGAVEASTGSGDITAEGLSARRLVGETGSGDVEVSFRTAPDKVDVDTGSGDGVVRVPAGAYDVVVSTGAGEERVEVDRDGSAPRRIVVRTGSGDAKVLSV